MSEYSRHPQTKPSLATEIKGINVDDVRPSDFSL